jgi:hypothetical protein
MKDSEKRELVEQAVMNLGLPVFPNRYRLEYVNILAKYRRNDLFERAVESMIIPPCASSKSHHAAMGIEYRPPQLGRQR